MKWYVALVIFSLSACVASPTDADQLSLAAGCQECSVAHCTDGIDNDGDGYVDCVDYDCGALSVCGGEPEVCDDGIDNDQDRHIDCDDYQCYDAPACNETSSASASVAECEAISPTRGLRSLLNRQTQSGHRRRGYSSQRRFMLDRLDRTSRGIECVYTGTWMNRAATGEHVWPRSKGAKGFAEGDLHNLRPALSRANSSRSNFPFGETPCMRNACSFDQGGSQLGRDRDGDLVFEVRPKYRGEIARAMFYFAVRYDYSIDAEQEQILRQWNCEDPPNETELERNDAIEGRQGNRNPFVDDSTLVSQISDF